MTENALSALLQIQKRKLIKALKHLAYSYEKVKLLSTDIDHLDEAQLETWESFAARFSRVTDIFLTRYLRTRVLISDPGFSGTLRDFVNAGEKLAILDNAERWLSIRELRNISAHDYTEEELGQFFKRLLQESPLLLQLEITINV